jgi:hypothetical protein
MAENWIEIKINPAQMNRVRAMLRDTPGGLKEALKNAIAKTVRATKPVIVEEILKGGHPQKSYLQGKVRYKTAINTLGAKIMVRGSRLPLKAFGTWPTSRGIGFLTGHAGFIPGAFFATMPKGYTGIFKRYTAGWRGSRKVGAETSGELGFGLAAKPVVPRLGIQEIYGPSAGAMLSQAPGAIGTIQRFAGTMLERMVDIQAEKLIGAAAYYEKYWGPKV